MGAYIEKENAGIRPGSASEREEASELVKWLSVSGDMDDFIYYGDDARVCSER